MRHKIIAKAGIPNQCALKDLVILPLKSHAMAWPIPQPGHQVMPSNLSGHKVKCVLEAGLLKASATNAAIQKIISKYLAKSVLINFV
jgi:hypothetical protein